MCPPPIILGYYLPSLIILPSISSLKMLSFNFSKALFSISRHLRIFCCTSAKNARGFLKSGFRRLHYQVSHFFRGWLMQNLACFCKKAGIHRTEGTAARTAYFYINKTVHRSTQQVHSTKLLGPLHNNLGSLFHSSQPNILYRWF